MALIRQCIDSDFQPVVKLLGQLWPDKTLNQEKLRQVFTRGLACESHNYICATVQDKIIGFASLKIKNSLWEQGNLGYIDELVVDQEYRGKGIGRELLEHVVEMAREKGCGRIELDAAFYRKASHRFYEKNNFEKRCFLFSRKL